MLKTIHAASSSRIVLNILFTVIRDFFQIFYNVLFFSYFMNAVENKMSIYELLKVLLIVTVINIIFESLNAYYHQVYIPKNDVKLSLSLRKMVYEKVLTVDMECFDNPQYYDNVTFALNDLYNRVKSILNNLSQFVSHLFFDDLFSINFSLLF